MFQIHLDYCFAANYLRIIYVGILLRSYTDASCIIATNNIYIYIKCLHLRSSSMFICYLRTISSCVVSWNLLLVNTPCFKCYDEGNFILTNSSTDPRVIYLRGDRLLSRESRKGFHFIDALLPAIFAHKKFISHCHLCYLV